MHIKIQKEKITKLCGDKGYIREWNIKERNNIHIYFLP
jgi:hypothetical protein